MNRFERHPFLSIIFIIIVLSFPILIAGEVMLRIKGQKPGYYSNSYFFNKVDSLYMTYDYVADKDGIMVVGDSARKWVAENISYFNSQYSIVNSKSADSIMNLHNEWSVKRLVVDYAHLDAKINYDNDFNRYVDSLKRNKEQGRRDEVDEALLQHCKSPINTDGYRSIEFKDYHTKKKKILLLGDSFTWGLSANPLTGCFADIITSKGNVCFNTGIVGADPAQYAAVAEKYIPKLKPDVVIINFYMGNDIFWYKRKPKPFQLPFYSTNAGWLMAYPDCEYLEDFHDAYEYAKGDVIIPDIDKKPVNWLCAQTVIGSKAWFFLKKFGLVKPRADKYMDYWQRNKVQYYKQPVSEYFIKRIKNACDSNGAKMLLVVIPDMKYANPRISNLKPQDVFKETKFYVPDNLLPDDFNNVPDGHLNNAGHKKYAEFLLKKIEK